jgi:hypothetical protein
MRPVLLAVVIAVLGLCPGGADAQQLAQATGGAAARAGVAAAVRGEVKLAAVPGVREVGKDVASGDPIFLGDQVTTGSEGRLQIMLADETVFTIGPNAAMVIDNFVYDPSTSAGKVTASVLKGTFRFVTGKVAKREPSDMEVKLPVGSIGVRGTSVAGETDGTRATVVLLGPGPDTNTGERVGRILVTGTGATGAATTVEIVRPGFGTEITGANVPPTAAVRIDPGRISAITAPLAGTAPRAAPQPTAPGQQPGGQQQAQPQQPGPAQQPGSAQQPGPVQPQAQAQPGQPSGGPPVAGQVIAGGPSLLAQSGAQAAGGLAYVRTAVALAPATQQANQIAGILQQPLPVGTLSTFEQLRSISSGTATFTSRSVSLTGGPGTASYTINYSYNFASRTANGSVSVTAGAGWGTTGTQSVALIASPFTTGSGEVKLGETINVPGGPGGTLRIDYQFRNSNNVIFKTLDHRVKYNQGGTFNTGTSSFTGGNTATGQGATTRP